MSGFAVMCSFCHFPGVFVLHDFFLDLLYILEQEQRLPLVQDGGFHLFLEEWVYHAFYDISYLLPYLLNLITWVIVRAAGLYTCHFRFEINLWSSVVYRTLSFCTHVWI